MFFLTFIVNTDTMISVFKKPMTLEKTRDRYENKNNCRLLQQFAENAN